MLAAERGPSDPAPTVGRWRLILEHRQDVTPEARTAERLTALEREVSALKQRPKLMPATSVFPSRSPSVAYKPDALRPTLVIVTINNEITDPDRWALYVGPTSPPTPVVCEVAGGAGILAGWVAAGSYYMLAPTAIGYGGSYISAVCEHHL